MRNVAILRLARRSSTIGLADGQHCDDFRSINVKFSEYLKPLLNIPHVAYKYGLLPRAV